jgi:hypothetical protein
MDDDNGEEWTMCVQTPELYVEPPNNVDMDGYKQTEKGKTTGYDQIRPN